MSEQQLRDAAQNEINASDYARRADETESMIELRGSDSPFPVGDETIARWKRMAKADRKRAVESHRTAQRLIIMDRVGVRHWTDVPENERGNNG